MDIKIVPYFREYRDGGYDTIIYARGDRNARGRFALYEFIKRDWWTTPDSW